MNAHSPTFGAEMETLPAEPRPDLGPARLVFHRLRTGGLSAAEAGNLTARLEGLAVGRQPWTLREVEHLLFLRSIVESGRVAS